MSQIDLSQLPPEVLALVNAAQAAGQRSPIRKPLTDLRMPQSAKGRLNRPHFEWSAEVDTSLPAEPTSIWPRLYWDSMGVEQAIRDEEDLVRVQPSWTTSPPMLVSVSAQDDVQAMLEALSPEDRAAVLEWQKQARLQRIKDRLMALPDGAAASVTAAVSQTPTAVAPKAGKRRS